MSEVDQLSQLSDRALVAEFVRRAPQLPDGLKAQASAALTERSRVTDALSGDGAPAPGGKPDKAPDKPPLTPERMTELLGALETRFSNTPQHYNTPAFQEHREGITFNEVKTCLQNDPALARTVYAMHKRGGQPDVWGRAGKSFLFFEAAKETCPASRNCVYDRKSADWLRTNRPNEQFKGSVEEQRAEMGGAGVAHEELWREMQKLGIFTVDSWEWLGSDDITDAGRARGARRDGGDLFVRRYRAGDHYPGGGWRAVAKGSEA